MPSNSFPALKSTHWGFRFASVLFVDTLTVGTTAHVTAMFAAFFAAGVALGAPPLLLGLLLSFSSSLNMSLTHYATGTAPIIFGSGYTTLNEWWFAGFVMSVINILIMVVVGAVWWQVLGYL